MKKTVVIFTILACVAFSSANAQKVQKYGHINTTEVVKVMPGYDTIATSLTAFLESLQNEYEAMTKEFQNKKDKFDKEAGLMSSSVRQLREQELVNLQKIIQDFAGSVEEDLYEKQAQLLQPFQEKLQAALKKVAEENNYTYIFETQTLLFYENGDDVTPLVKKALGIK